MSVTFTPKGLPQWQLGTDSPSRELFNAAFALIDDGFMADIQGSLSSRPSPGIAGRFFTATDSGNTGLMFRDNGSIWQAVNPAVTSSGGGTTTVVDQVSTVNVVATTAANNGIPLVAQGLAGQTGNLFSALTYNGSVVFGVDPAGDVNIAGSLSASGPISAASGSIGGGLTVSGALSAQSLTVNGTAITGMTTGHIVGGGQAGGYPTTDSQGSVTIAHGMNGTPIAAIGTTSGANTATNLVFATSAITSTTITFMIMAVEANGTITPWGGHQTGIQFIAII